MRRLILDLHSMTLASGSVAVILRVYATARDKYHLKTISQIPSSHQSTHNVMFSGQAREHLSKREMQNTIFTLTIWDPQWASHSGQKNLRAKRELVIASLE
jgi:hypothetical protein